MKRNPQPGEIWKRLNTGDLSNREWGHYDKMVVGMEGEDVRWRYLHNTNTSTWSLHVFLANHELLVEVESLIDLYYDGRSKT